MSRVVLDCSTISLSTWVVVVAGGLQDFSVSPCPLWVNLGFEQSWTGLGFGTNGFIMQNESAVENLQALMEPPMSMPVNLAVFRMILSKILIGL